MYRVYFDNIEQDVKDIININSVIALTIIREDGITSTEQILREKTEMELQFTGCAYDYICGKIATDRCTEIQFSIEDTDTGISFNGVINTTMCELKIAQRIGKTKIKDDSFSAYIRNVLDVDVSLFTSLTVNCYDLSYIKEYYIMKDDSATDTTTVSIQGFDVLNVFKFLVNYFTDNSMDVVSTFLTNNKYFITTGFNMHNRGFSNEDIYPEISISRLFSELRKKFRLYMGIERYPNGVAYLRIEDENYFFSNTPLMTIPDVPFGLTQSYDTDRNYSGIENGSEKYEVTDDGVIVYPQRRYYSWKREKYSMCGSCLADTKNTLDLVSGFIIDTSVIYEALNYGDNDYENDSSIFLINYHTVSGIGHGKRTLISGVYIYNDAITNNNVLEYWSGNSSQCISISSYPKNGFLIKKNDYEVITTIVIVDGLYTFCQQDRMDFPDVNYDIEANIVHLNGNITTSANLCYGELPGIGVDVDYFEVPVNGTYNFRAGVSNFRQLTLLGDNFPLDFMISIDTYTDNTLTTIIASYTETVTGVDAVNDGVNITVETGQIILSAGNCVMVSISFYCPSGDAASGTIEHGADTIYLEMVADSNSCNQLEPDLQNSKPYLVEFDYPLCAEDYLLIKDNKSGYIEIAGNRYWIKELTYKQGLSQLKLMGNSSLC